MQWVCNVDLYVCLSDYSLVGSIEGPEMITTGHKLCLTCYSVAHPLWFKDNVPLYESYKRGHFGLKIVKVDKSHTGKYICKGTNRKKKVFISEKMVYVGGKFELEKCIGGNLIICCNSYYQLHTEGCILSQYF